MTKIEKQLNFLLPISNSRSLAPECKVAKAAQPTGDTASVKRYVQIKESLKNKGLIKSR
ncbi:hypothetical protein [Shinella sp. M27]|uniref:hypothetical protein n=1 Tax=Shinella sp. M27 TaxID=3368614 RepID=UPI003B9F5E3E